MCEAYVETPDPVDEERAATWKCGMVLYNTHTYAISDISKLIGCQVLDIDPSMGMGASESALFLRIEGIRNAEEAVKRMRDNKGPERLYFKQANDHYEKLRNVGILGVPAELRNYDEWKSAIRSALVPHGEIAEVGVYKSGFASVTFCFLETTAKFETRTGIRFNAMGLELKAIRTPAPMVKSTGDVVVEGFYHEDKLEVLRLIVEKFGTFKRASFFAKGKMGVILSMTKFKVAQAMVDSEMFTFQREGSRIQTVLTAMYAVDHNTRKDSNNKGGGQSQQDAIVVEKRIMDLEQKYKDETRAVMTEFRKYVKDSDEQRKSDLMVLTGVMIEGQNAVMTTMTTSIHSMHDKQMRLHRLNTQLSDSKMERMSLSRDISELVRIPNKDKALEEELHHMKTLRTALDAKVETLEKDLLAVVDQPIVVGALEYNPAVRIQGLLTNNDSPKKPLGKKITAKPTIPHDSEALIEFSASKGNSEGMEQTASLIWEREWGYDLENWFVLTDNKWSHVSEPGRENDIYDNLRRIQSFIMVFGKTQIAVTPRAILTDVGDTFMSMYTDKKKGKK
jgi:hypothetical protein